MRIIRYLVSLSFVLSLIACGVASVTPAAGNNPSSPQASGIGQPSLTGDADVIFTNGMVLTMDSAHPTAEGIALKGNEILAVGTNQEVLKERGDSTTLISLDGHTLMPGFVDAHAHIGGAAQGNPDQFRQIQDEVIKSGITTETEMGVIPDLLDQLKGYDQTGLMRIRWNVYLLYNTNCGDRFDTDWYKTYKQGEQLTPHIRNQGVKVFSDGGSCNVPAVTFEYPGGYGQGDLYMTQDQLTAVVKEVQDSGHQVAIHALGDRAIEEAQNAIAAALNGAPNIYRHRIEHNAVLHDALLPRYNQIGIIPVIFGSYPTCWRVNPTSQFKYAVPEELGTWEWPWRALLDANPGIKAAWHSDYGVFTDIGHMANLYGFVTRNQVAPDGSICQAPDWLKQGAITADEALHIMTINSAYALFREKEIGSLEAGKLADLIILSENPLQVQPEAIKDIHVLMTMIDGKVEYCAAGAESLCPSASSPNTAPQGAGSAPGPMTTTASASLPDHPPADAIDGSPDTWWSAGTGPEQWIQIDLGKPTTISSIRLVISQYPEGETDHQLWAGPDANNLTLVHEFRGLTKDPDTLEFKPSEPLTNIRFIKVVTTQSPSWVAWREIEVMGQ